MKYRDRSAVLVDLWNPLFSDSIVVRVLRSFGQFEHYSEAGLSPFRESKMRKSFRSIRAAVAAAGAVTVLALGSCLDINDLPEGLSILTIVDGNNQNIPAGSNANSLLVVRALDHTGTAMSGVVVNWTIVQGGGTLGAPTSVTDINGEAAVSYIAPAATGTVFVRAMAQDLTVTFNLTIVPPPDI